VTAPAEYTYWVDPGRLLAGTYPAPKLAVLLAAGVATFVDLTEGDLPDYAAALPPGVAHHRIAVPDFTSPRFEQIREALDLIARSEGLVYLHCEGGCGRTGVVAGCYLVEHGLEPAAALERVHELTRSVSARPCPEGDDQIATVLGWAG
jgi:protein-tyrosine phosphatase